MFPFHQVISMSNRRLLRHNYILFITGPTASGKTNFSLQVADALERRAGRKAQIINADVGQFYTSLSVGTAKPDWRNLPVQHHLFDILDSPEECNVFAYRDMVLSAAEKILKEGDLPIVVGGSLFYIRSIFFPPAQQAGQREVERKSIILSEDERRALWERLKEIDPERASQIHANDTYRVMRAIDLWEKTGEKPSAYEPEFCSPCHTRVVFLDLKREELFDRIGRRTKQMILEDGWIDEVKELRNSSWEKFLLMKKFIGYSEIFSWLARGEEALKIDDLIGLIQKKTRHYAKRQITFWKKFRNLLLYYDTRYQSTRHQGTQSDLLCKAETIAQTGAGEVEEMCSKVLGDLEQVEIG